VARQVRNTSYGNSITSDLIVAKCIVRWSQVCNTRGAATRSLALTTITFSRTSANVLDDHAAWCPILLPYYLAFRSPGPALSLRYTRVPDGTKSYKRILPSSTQSPVILKQNVAVFNDAPHHT
jgi:hypothetical protein